MINARMTPESASLEWWPSHVRKAFANLGCVLGPSQLKPSVLAKVSREGLPGHTIVFRHLSGTERGTRKGVYLLSIEGPAIRGEWSFTSGLLETLARAAARDHAENQVDGAARED